jgi:hypothetical protein
LAVGGEREFGLLDHLVAPVIVAKQRLAATFVLKPDLRRSGNRVNRLEPTPENCSVTGEKLALLCPHLVRTRRSTYTL